ncbi:MAG: hypothetical protein M0R46_06235 [Candidatus Muirbacterium halophilum]|nr:hypothetical protein [Candidatus Muirbacterium halophilum]
MNRERYYNKKTIWKVIVKDTQISDFYRFKKKTIFDRLFNKDTNYIVDMFYGITHDKFTIEEFLKMSNAFYIKDNEVYVKPHVKIIFTNKEEEEFYFNTLIEAHNYKNSIIDDNYDEY